MSHDTQMDTQDFAERLGLSFAGEPPHATVEDDVARGRRRLRRHRAVAAAGGLAVAAAAVGAVTGVAGLLPGPHSPTPVASGGVPDAAVVHDCLQVNERVSVGDHLVPRAELLERMGDARLMTRADAGDSTVATLRSEDRTQWLECRLSHREPAVKAITLLYPTAVSFPHTTVGGVRAYEPHSESDPRLSGTATGPVPQFEVGCDVQQPEETAAWDREAAACPTYTLTWNDRRPAEVARVRVTAPDGRELDADVQQGYLSLAYTGTMTPGLRGQVAAGQTPQARRVTFYDRDGNVLVDDRDPGHLPTAADPGIESFPSLAWWLR